MSAKRKLPVVGQRILKTAAAVFLCMLLYKLRKNSWTATESVVAVIICMQPYTRDSIKTAISRLIGTLIGAIWGLLFLCIIRLFPGLENHQIIIYALIALGVIIVLYSAVLIRQSESAALCAMVFLWIAICFPEMDNPLMISIDRLIDTAIGIGVALIVNVIHLPRKKNQNLVFFLHFQYLIENRYERIPSRVLIELNRLYDEGAKICLESKWAPAFLLPQVSMLKINMPLIVMNGAAIYDINKNEFLDLISIPYSDAHNLSDYLTERNLAYSTFTVRNNSLYVFLKGNPNEIQRKNYETMRKSPYRNYIPGDFTEEYQVAFIRVLLPDLEAEALYQEMNTTDLAAKLCIIKRKHSSYKDYTGIYFYHPDASIQEMECRIIEHMPQKNQYMAVHMEPLTSHYTPERDAPLLLHRLRNLYMPVSLRRNKESNPISGLPGEFGKAVKESLKNNIAECSSNTENPPNYESEIDAEINAKKNTETIN